MLFLACVLSCVLSSYARAQAPAPGAKRSLSSAKQADRLGALEDARAGREPLSGEALWRAWETEADPLVQVRLLQALSRVEGAAAVTELTAAVRFAPSSMVRQAAAQELGHYASEARVRRALLDAFAAETAPAVRYACALSLSFAPGPEAEAGLEAAAGDADPALRRQAAYALKRRPGAKAKAALKRLERDADASVRTAAGGKGK